MCGTLGEIHDLTVHVLCVVLLNVAENDRNSRVIQVYFVLG